MESPNLIEYNVLYHIQNTLQSCHQNRVQFYSNALNIIVLIVFVVIVFFTLYYSYRKKPTQYEQHAKMLHDQQYVMSKIRYYKEQQQNILTSPMGNL
jgi:heme/copper-type cytochrome/quinol oxidase subunit 2